MLAARCAPTGDSRQSRPGTRAARACVAPAANRTFFCEPWHARGTCLRPAVAPAATHTLLLLGWLLAGWLRTLATRSTTGHVPSQPAANIHTILRSTGEPASQPASNWWSVL